MRGKGLPGHRAASNHVPVQRPGRASQCGAIGHVKTLPILRMKFGNVICYVYIIYNDGYFEMMVILNISQVFHE